MKVLFVDTVTSRPYEGPRAAIVSLTSALRLQGVEVACKPFSLLNQDIGYREFIEIEDGFVSEIEHKATMYDYLFLSCWTGSWGRAKRIARRVKNGNADVQIAIGGPHIDYTEMYRRGLLNPLRILHDEVPEVNFFVYGESEKTILDLVQGAKTKGMSYREGDRVVDTGWKRLSENLDSLPFPDIEEEIRGKRWVYIEGSRGCVHRCKFCSEYTKWSDPDSSRSYRIKSPNRIVKEILYFLSLGINHFRFTDSSITTHPDLEELCDDIINKGIQIPWSGFARVDEVLRAPLEKLKETGCETLLVGFESGSKGELARMEKGYLIDQAYEAIRRLKKIGIKTRGSWVVGYPGETEEDFQATLDFAVKLDLDTYSVHTYEDQAHKFREYNFFPTDFELDMPNKAFTEFVASNRKPLPSEMHVLPRLEPLSKDLPLSNKERKILERIRRFQEATKKPDQTYDTQDRFDRHGWEIE